LRSIFEYSAFACFEDGDISIGVVPEVQELLVLGTGVGRVTGESVSSFETVPSLKGVWYREKAR